MSSVDSFHPMQIRAVAKSMKLDEAAEKSNAQAIIAAFAPFKDSKVGSVPAEICSPLLPRRRGLARGMGMKG